MSSPNKTASQSLLPWLRANKIPLGALTSTDTKALFAAVHIAQLWMNTSERKVTEEAFARIVLQMQEHTRFMAFHAIAHVGDWCHRWELWRNAGLPAPVGCPECAYGPAPKKPAPAAVECTCDRGGMSTPAAECPIHGEEEVLS